MYKLPKTKTSRGTEYFYMDRNSQSFGNIHLDITSETNNPLYNTLSPLYMNVSKRLKYMFNADFFIELCTIKYDSFSHL